MKSEYIEGRRVHRRRSVQLEVSIKFRNPFSRNTGPLDEGLTLVGRTKNIGEGGIAVVVSAGNIDRYLKRKDLPIEIKLRLPSGSVEVHATPVHFKRFTSIEGAVTYVIGSAFLNTDELAALLRFLESLPGA